jgi:hypothetical protein
MRYSDVDEEDIFRMTSIKVMEYDDNDNSLVVEETSTEKLDKIPLADIEQYLRRKKLENIENK